MKKKSKHVCPILKEVQWVDRPIEKVVYRTSFTIIMKWIITVGIGIGISAFYCGSYSEIRLQSKIDQPYVVYRPDKETTAKLQDCQDSWRADQVTKKLLRQQLKEIQIP